MDAQTAVEQPLGTENLTDDLDDEAADKLIEWGTNSLRTLITPDQDDKTSAAKLDKIMGLMRAVRQIARNANDSDPKGLQHYIQLFLNNATEVFPAESVTRGKGVVKSIANGVAGKTPTQAIQQLLTAVVPATPAESPAGGTTEETATTPTESTDVSFDETDDPVM